MLVKLLCVPYPNTGFRLIASSARRTNPQPTGIDYAADNRRTSSRCITQLVQVSMDPEYIELAADVFCVVLNDTCRTPFQLFMKFRLFTENSEG